MHPEVLAVGCHPDDIEFLMAGTFFLLKKAGCSLHYINLANGNCGTSKLGRGTIRRIRRREAVRACEYIGAAFHGSFTSDLAVFYRQKLIRKLTAVVRETRPDIMLVLSPEDYMEDHMNTARISVTAAFCRGMKNYRTVPRREPYMKDVVLYHAMPYGLTDWMHRKIDPEFLVNIGSVIDSKEGMLACHSSQKVWLDESQGHDSYLTAMREMSRKTGALFGKEIYAEGWRRHLYLGFSEKDADPLGDMLEKYIVRPSE